MRRNRVVARAVGNGSLFRQYAGVILPLLAAALLVLTLAAAVAWAGDQGPSRKVLKQINVMERAIDEMLVDSPNLLVASTHVVQGMYLEEVGALFGFEAAIITRDFWRHHGKWCWVSDWDDDDDDGAVVRHRRKRPSDEELLRRGKAEILGVMLDYSDVLSALRDDQWLVISATIKNKDSWLGEDKTEFMWKARMSDLRAYASGKVSESDTIKKVIQQES